MSSGSGSGSGADQHLLALLRAIRLRQAVPDAVAAGISDTAAALTEMGLTGHPDPTPGRSGQTPALPAGEAAARPGDPAALPPGGSGAAGDPAASPGAAHPGDPAALPPGGSAPHPDDPAGRRGDPASYRGDPTVYPAAGSGVHPWQPATPLPGGSGARRGDPAALPPGESHSALAPGSVPRGLPPGPPPAAGGSTGPGQPLRPHWADPGVHPEGDHRPAQPRPAGPFFNRGPQLRPQGLTPGDPAHPPFTGPSPGATNPGPGAGRAGSSVPGSGPGAAYVGPEARTGFDAGMDEVGRLSRNRFAGLPVPKPPATRPQAGRPGAEDVDTSAWAAGSPKAGQRPAPGGRPSWATGDRSGPIGAITPVGSGGVPVPLVPPLAGLQAPRVPGLENPQYVMPPMVSSGRASPPGAGGADGMDPSDDLLLLETQRLLSTSLTFAGGQIDVAERLRAALLQAHPALIEALPGTPESQVEQLAGGLTWLVHNLAHPPVLVAGCAQLGAALAAVGVAPHHLQFVGAALAEAMRAGMPPGAWRQDFDLAWRSTWLHAYEWIVHGETTVAQQPAIWTATVVEHDLRRHDLAVIRLRPDVPMPFTPGQYARIEVSELPGIWRPYSLAGAPRRDDVIELHVRAKTQSGVSGSLVYRTRAGDRLRISHAEGTMVLPEPPGRDLLMIAGDTGVVPLKALLTELADTGDPRSAVLFWGVRNLAELYDIDEITEIARAARRATVVPVVSEGDPGPYASGLVTDAVAAYGEWSDHEVFLAGPPLMLAATSAALHQLGVAPRRIHHDTPE